MSAADLKRMGKAYGYNPEGWHLQLADIIGAGPVLHIFRFADLIEGKRVVFYNRARFVGAASFEAAVKKILGADVMIVCVRAREAQASKPERHYPTRLELQRGGV